MAEPVAIGFLTLGCPKNEVDSDRMAAAVEASTYRRVEDLAEADVVVLNTCAFIQAATEESIAEAFELFTKWRPLKPGRKVIVAGCMPSRYGEDLAVAMTEADALLPVADEDSLLEVIGRLTGAVAVRSAGPGRTKPSATAYLKVSEGCDRRCAYCAIPAIRGPFVSATPESITAEAQSLIDQGAHEIVLVGQDVASYGVDCPAYGDLSTLLERLDVLEGDYRIRLMYLQPDGVSDALLGVIARSRHICRYLDIPLQHASRRVLEAMARTGSGEEYLELLGRVRSVMPDVVLRTTVMAGFPGETEDDLQELEWFLETAGFDYAGVFAYSPEEGTPAAAYDGQIPDEEREARAQRLRDVADAVGFARARTRVGRVERVLVEGVEEGELYGRTSGQAPEVDGVTLLEADAPLGEFVEVEVTEALGYDLVGVPR